VPRLAAAAKQSSIIPFALALWFANQTPVHHQLQSTLGGCGFEARGWAVPFIMWLLYSFASSFFSFFVFVNYDCPFLMARQEEAN